MTLRSRTQNVFPAPTPSYGDILKNPGSPTIRPSDPQTLHASLSAYPAIATICEKLKPMTRSLVFFINSHVRRACCARQFPAVPPPATEQVRIIIPATPFNEQNHWSSASSMRTRWPADTTAPVDQNSRTSQREVCRDSDCSNSCRLRQKSCTLLPLHDLSPSVSIKPARAARIASIDFVRIKTWRFGQSQFFSPGHQDGKVHAPISGRLDFAVTAGQLGVFEFVPAVRAKNRR